MTTTRGGIVAISSGAPGETSRWLAASGGDTKGNQGNQRKSNMPRGGARPGAWTPPQITRTAPAPGHIPPRPTRHHGSGDPDASSDHRGGLAANRHRDRVVVATHRFGSRRACSCISGTPSMAKGCWSVCGCSRALRLWNSRTAWRLPRRWLVNASCSWRCGRLWLEK